VLGAAVVEAFEVEDETTAALAVAAKAAVTIEKCIINERLLEN